MTEESRLNFELEQMTAPAFTLCLEDRFALATTPYWVDTTEQGDDDYDDTWEMQPMKSGACWQLLPTEYKVFIKGNSHHCPKCNERNDTYLVLIGKNHLGVEYMFHLSWQIAQAMLKAGIITSDDFSFTTSECCTCFLGGLK
ncbi:hypothetical protein UFOVP467_29 [uncultured Caudovirales phage]|uniref:Uncharacterized protein n=1 Tax=uncultured Caudovirales phage TaxID=2100421 RepID=A0A6J5MN38_9CAUD|nr:hypothetical protein UFOVP467_29 [uncultured Caudovirales phage]